jgi:hypothetical protein
MGLGRYRKGEVSEGNSLLEIRRALPCLVTFKMNEAWLIIYVTLVLFSIHAEDMCSGFSIAGLTSWANKAFSIIIPNLPVSEIGTSLTPKTLVVVIFAPLAPLSVMRTSLPHKTFPTVFNNAHLFQPVPERRRFCVS